MELPQSNTKIPVYSYTRTDLFFVTETWLSAQGDEAKTVEFAPSRFDVKSFPRQSRSRGGGIATVYIIIIIMVIFKCYFSGELIALSLKNIYIF